MRWLMLSPRCSLSFPIKGMNDLSFCSTDVVLCCSRPDLHPFLLILVCLPPPSQMTKTRELILGDCFMDVHAEDSGTPTPHSGVPPSPPPEDSSFSRIGVLLPNHASPSCAKMRRRFYHLGVERTDLPPRDAAHLLDPGCVAYIPEVPPGLNATHELQRNLVFNATGSPPPKPKYFSDIDRCRHCAHPISGGGMDVGPHLINRPGYKLSVGDYVHTDMYKNLLTINMRELGEIRSRASSTSLHRAGSMGQHSAARVGGNVEWSPSSRRAQASPQPAVTPQPDDGVDDASPNGRDERPSPAPTLAGSPSRSIRSLDIARRSSSLEATKQARRRTVLLKQEKQLALLTRMGHPNQITVYIPQ